MSQKTYNGIENLEKELINENCYLLVCDNSYDELCISDYIGKLMIPHIRFSDFTSNPLHQDVKKGLNVLLSNNIRTIVAVGGGSTIDVAKCIKYDSCDNNIKIIAIPTTAGTGSESTKHIVVYSNGEKESISSEAVIPDVIIFEPNVLGTLPRYIKFCTLLDAFCQSIESYWSVNATIESKEYARKAMKILYMNYEKYLIEGYFDKECARQIMIAANLSGKAINISQTTAAHAMSYKITSKYNVPHGHAVGLCLFEIWNLSMNKKSESTLLNNSISEIVNILELRDEHDVYYLLHSMLNYFDARKPLSNNYDEDIEELSNSVNQTRMKNNPVQFTDFEIKSMYKSIVLNGETNKYENRRFY